MRPSGRWSKRLPSSEVAMDVNSDFRDLLRDLSDCGVRFLVVGAHALMYHTEPRYTKDLDLWVEPTEANAVRVWKALNDFGAPVAGVKPADFTDPDLVYQIGVEPNRIDVMMGIQGVTFEKAWPRRIRTTYGKVRVYLLSREDLIRTKRAAGRPQDMLDLDRLKTRAAKRRSSSKRKRQ